MTTEKKIYTLNSREYKIIKGSRWYVEYYLLHPSNVRERVKESGGINRIKDLALREQKAIELIETIDARLYSNDGVNRGHVNDLKLSKPSVLLKTLAEYRSYFRQKTWQSSMTRIKYFLIWLNGKPDADVTTHDANAFLLYLMEHRHSTTAYSYKRTLSSLYNKATGNKSNPFAKAISPARPTQSLMFFTDWQIQLIKGYCLRTGDHTMWLAIQLIFYCFIRPGEMRLLKFEHINWQYGFIEIPADISKNKKTQKVSIPTALAVELAQSEYMMTRTGYIFSRDVEGLIPVAKNHFNDRHRIILKAVKIVGKYAFYSWKHTGVVKAVKAGINIKDLQMQLRHHSLDMVNEYLKNLGVMDSDELKSLFPAI